MAVRPHLFAFSSMAARPGLILSEPSTVVAGNLDKLQEISENLSDSFRNQLQKLNVRPHLFASSSMAASPGLILSEPLTVVAGNLDKLQEISEILGDSFRYQLLKLNVMEIQGQPDLIAMRKAYFAASQVKRPVLVEDTCLCFNALNGFPGPYVEWYVQMIGHEGLNNLLMAYEDKSAYALSVCSILLEPNTVPITFHAKTMGKIVPARGQNGIGWDAIFQPDGSELTYAEMSKEEKNKISHRSKSLSLVKAFLRGATYNTL